MFVDALAAVVVDLCHFGILLGSVLAFCGVWGHFFFGALARDWSTVGRSLVAILRMVVYDYDLQAMELVRARGGRESAHAPARKT